MIIWFIFVHFLLLLSETCSGKEMGFLGITKNNSMVQEISDIVNSSIKRNSVQRNPNIQSNIINLLRSKCYNSSNLQPILSKPLNRKDNPNMKQSMMAHAFINSINEVFKNDNPASAARNSLTKSKSEQFLKNNYTFMNPSRKITVMVKEPADSKVLARRMVNDLGQDESNVEASNRIKESSRVHSSKTGETGIMWARDNYSYTLNLPAHLMKQNIVENLVSAICNAVEEVRTNEATVSNEMEEQSFAKQTMRIHREDPKPVIPQLYCSNQYPLSVSQGADEQNQISSQNPENCDLNKSIFKNPTQSFRDLSTPLLSEKNNKLQKKHCKNIVPMMHHNPIIKYPNEKTDNYSSDLFKPDVQQKYINEADTDNHGFFGNFQQARQARDKDLKIKLINNERLTDSNPDFQSIMRDGRIDRKAAEKFSAPPPVWMVGKTFTDQTVQELFEGATQPINCGQKQDDGFYNNWSRDAIDGLNCITADNSLSNDIKDTPNVSFLQHPLSSAGLNQLKNIKLLPCIDDNLRLENTSANVSFSENQKANDAIKLEQSFHEGNYTPFTNDIKRNDFQQFDFDILPQRIVDYRGFGEHGEKLHQDTADIRKRKSSVLPTEFSDHAENSKCNNPLFLEGMHKSQEHGYEPYYNSSEIYDNKEQTGEGDLYESKPGIELGLSKSSPVIRISIPIDLEMIKETLQNYYQLKDSLEDSDNMVKYRRYSGTPLRKPFVKKFSLPTSVVFTKRNIQDVRNCRRVAAISKTTENVKTLEQMGNSSNIVFDKDKSNLKYTKTNF